MDMINLRQTANIIFHLSCYNEPLACQIVQMLLTSAQKLPIEQAQSFFKLLSFLTEVGENGLPGLPSFIGIILPRIWQVRRLIYLGSLQQHSFFGCFGGYEFAINRLVA